MTVLGGSLSRDGQIGTWSHFRDGFLQALVTQPPRVSSEGLDLPQLWARHRDGTQKRSVCELASGKQWEVLPWLGTLVLVRDPPPG